MRISHQVFREFSRKGAAHMAYSELIKNFDRIRDYMRQFYV